MLILQLLGSKQNINFRDFYQFYQRETTIKFHITYLHCLMLFRWRKPRNVKKAEQTRAQKSLTSNVRGNRGEIKRRFPEKQ